MKSLVLLLVTATSFTAVEPSTTLMQRIMKAADKYNDGKLTLEEYKTLDVQAPRATRAILTRVTSRTNRSWYLLGT